MTLLSRGIPLEELIMFTISLYVGAAVLLLLSAFKDKGRTLAALRKQWKSFENILPQFLAMILIIGLTLALSPPEIISRIIGEETGWLGMLGVAVVGAITLIPWICCFPFLTRKTAYSSGIGKKWSNCRV